MCNATYHHLLHLPLLLMALCGFDSNGMSSVVVEAFTHQHLTYINAPGHQKNHNRNQNQNIKRSANQARPSTCLLYAQDSSQQQPTESRTLYEILSIPPDATRSEIKKRYLKLAKVLHPDAQGKNGGTEQAGDLTFIEVSDAYRLLYDPVERKKYDREIRAQMLKGDIERAAENFGESAVPVLSSLFESVFKPMIRKTAVTTGAVISAVQAQAREQQQYRNQNANVTSSSFSSAPTTTAGGGTSASSTRYPSSTNGNAKNSGTAATSSSSSSENVSKAEEKKGFDLASATVAAIKAGQDAGRIVDNLELLQKAKDLEKKWQKDSDKAEVIRIKLAEVAEDRLRQAILTPDSKLDAWEAAEILNSFNTTNSGGTFVDTVMLRNSVQREIDVLYEKEAERDMFQADAAGATEIHQTNLKAMDKCQNKLKKANQVR